MKRAPQIARNRCEDRQERITHERGLLLLRDTELTPIATLNVAHDALAVGGSKPDALW